MVHVAASAPHRMRRTFRGNHIHNKISFERKVRFAIPRIMGDGVGARWACRWRPPRAVTAMPGCAQRFAASQHVASSFYFATRLLLLFNHWDKLVPVHSFGHCRSSSHVNQSIPPSTTKYSTIGNDFMIPSSLTFTGICIPALIKRIELLMSRLSHSSNFTSSSSASNRSLTHFTRFSRKS